MSRGTALFLCNLTMNMAEPWLANGYRVVMVDPQHGETFNRETIECIAGTIVQAMPRLGEIIRTERVVFGAGFPPCTDVAVSGARWFEAKRKKDPHFQAKAAVVAEQCRSVLEMTGAPWFWENPVSVFSQIFGKPDHTFHPHHYTKYCADDNYTKLTTLRVGGGFVMPEPAKDETLGAPDDRIHKAPPSDERANFRSATPRGFAMACYLSNAPHLRAERMAA